MNIDNFFEGDIRIKEDLLKIKTKFFLSMILSKFDKKSNFYNSYLKNQNQDKTQKINAKDYSITPYEKNHNPLFFVAVCHKTNEL